MLFNFQSITSILINVPITLVALTGHELGHAWVSTKLGDPTPQREGRLTWNPLAHLDLMGTILMILTGFGWAKPVMINPMYYKDRKKGTALVSLAGPLSNLLMSVIALLIYALLYVIQAKTGVASAAFSFITNIVTLFVFRNLCFMVFNLIPIPPLDGSKVLGLFLNDKAYYTMLQYERYSMILIMVLSLTGVFSGIIGTGVNFVLKPLVHMVNALIGIFL